MRRGGGFTCILHMGEPSAIFRIQPNASSQIFLTQKYQLTLFRGPKNQGENPLTAHIKGLTQILSCTMSGFSRDGVKVVDVFKILFRQNFFRERSARNCLLQLSLAVYFVRGFQRQLKTVVT